MLLLLLLLVPNDLHRRTVMSYSQYILDQIDKYTTINRANLQTLKEKCDEKRQLKKGNGKSNEPKRQYLNRMRSY